MFSDESSFGRIVRNKYRLCTCERQRFGQNNVQFSAVYLNVIVHVSYPYCLIIKREVQMYLTAYTPREQLEGFLSEPILRTTFVCCPHCNFWPWLQNILTTQVDLSTILPSAKQNQKIYMCTTYVILDWLHISAQKGWWCTYIIIDFNV